MPYGHNISVSLKYRDTQIHCRDFETDDVL